MNITSKLLMALLLTSETSVSPENSWLSSNRLIPEAKFPIVSWALPLRRTSRLLRLGCDSAGGGSCSTASIWSTSDSVRTASAGPLLRSVFALFYRPRVWLLRSPVRSWSLSTVSNYGNGGSFPSATW